MTVVIMMMMAMKHWVKQIEWVVMVVVMCVVKVMSALEVLEAVYDVEGSVLVAFHVDDDDDDCGDGDGDVDLVLAGWENNRPIRRWMKMMANT